jgi:hypothetical protein
MTDHVTREQAIRALVDEMRDRSRLIRSGDYGNERAVASLVEMWADKLDALLTADTALSSSREMQLDAIVRWLLGEEGEFPNPPEKVAGRYFPLYWWRTELRRRVAALPDPNAAHGETPALRECGASTSWTAQGERPERRVCRLPFLHQEPHDFQPLAADQGERTTGP